MTLTAGFLIALYELKCKNPIRTWFLYPEIEEQMKTHFPHAAGAAIISAMTEELGFFCKSVFINESYGYMPILHFDPGVTPDQIFNQEVSPVSEITQNFFKQYFPEALEYYAKAIDAIYVQAAIIEDIKKNEKFEFSSTQLEQDFLSLAPKFNVQARSTSASSVVIQCKEECPVMHSSDSERVELFSLQQVLQIICNYVLFSKQNIYDYRALIRGILSKNGSFQKGHQSVVIQSITILNHKLIDLGYCYQNTDHLLNVNGGMNNDSQHPAQYSLELSKNFCQSDFSGEIGNLDTFHAMTISMLKNCHLSLQSHRFVHGTIKTKITYLLGSLEVRNTHILMALYNLVSGSSLKKFYGIDEIIFALDPDFKCLKEYTFYAEDYKKLATALIEFGYLIYKKIMGEIFFKIDRSAEFDAKDFLEKTPEGQITKNIFEELFQKYRVAEMHRKWLTTSIRLMYQFAMKTQAFSLLESDLKNIIVTKFKLDDTRLKQFYKSLMKTCENSILEKKEGVYFFIFHETAQHFLERVHSSLLPLYNVLLEKYKKQNQKKQSATNTNTILTTLAAQAQLVATDTPLPFPSLPQLSLTPAVPATSSLQAVTPPLAVVTSSPPQVVPPIPVVGSNNKTTDTYLTALIGQIEGVVKRQKVKKNQDVLGHTPENKYNNGTSFSN